MRYWYFANDRHLLGQCLNGQLQSLKRALKTCLTGVNSTKASNLLVYRPKKPGQHSLPRK